MLESTSVVSSRNRHCTGCNVISGSGLIGAGLYIAYHSKNLHKTIGKTVMLCLAGTFVGLGITRIMDLPPFRQEFSKIEDTE